MAFGTENIDRIKAMIFPAGQLRDGSGVFQAGVIQVSWHSGEIDKLFQVYVNGRQAGVTAHPQQRTLLVQYDHTHPVVIEVVWVTPGDRYEDFAGKLGGFKETEGAHAVVTLPRRGTIELGSSACLFWDGGTGVMDYAEPLAIQEVWPDRMDKWGWGQDGFGHGDFGYSGTAAPGWGQGNFARGEFGFDADLLVFESEELPRGTYQFTVRLTDGAGNQDEGEPEIVIVNIDPIPAGPGLVIESYDETNDELVFNIL